MTEEGTAAQRKLDIDWLRAIAGALAAVASAFGLAGGPLAEVRVYVPAAQAEEAARIFSELDFSGEDLAGAETDAETDAE